jgi:pheromone shutdown-related protein TraB
VLKKIDDRLILVGVAHVLPKSMAEVQNTILRERPEVVGVELCPARYLVLTSGARGGGGAVPPGRFQVALLNRLLYFLQSRVAQQTGMPAGEEMLTAVRSARKTGARLELIDQDINVTLQRLIGRMKTGEKLRLGAELLLSLLPFGQRIDLERVTEEQIVEQLLLSLRRSSPTAYEVLIRERDEYMAAKIEKLLAASSGKVICVVGAGHVPGLYRRLSARAREGSPKPWDTLKISWEQV